MGNDRHENRTTGLIDGFTPFLLQSINIEANGITIARKCHQTALGQLLALNEQYNHESYAVVLILEFLPYHRYRVRKF